MSNRRQITHNYCQNQTETISFSNLLHSNNFQPAVSSF